MYSKTSKINYTPRKLRLVANMVRGKKAEEALEFLKNVDKKGSIYVYKGVKSAISNALQSGSTVPELIIDEIRVDQSVLYKRNFYISRGRGRQKLKRYSTLVIKLK
jgi:large subunit ribosomal protein L22